jgi:protein Tex
MNTQTIMQIAAKTAIVQNQVQPVLRLLEEGCTIPFIARYRKEVTGGLDEVQIIAIRDAKAHFEELEKRKAAILSSLSERELLTEELKRAIDAAESLTLLEDIYLPFKQKKRTRGMVAKEAGLEPLADWIALEGRKHSTLSSAEVTAEAKGYLNPDKEIFSPVTALAGARDILSERYNEDKDLRQELRDLFSRQGMISSKAVPGKEHDREAAKFRDYFAWEELASKAPSHRILAILRGTDEGALISHFRPQDEIAIERLQRRVIGSIDPVKNAAAGQIADALRDGYKRLTAPSLENALRKECKERADLAAIEVFSDNVRQVLLSPPLGAKRILGIDPGMRTGCKVVCLDQKGDLLFHDAIYPLAPHNRTRESETLIRTWCAKYRIEAIAVGNGTGGRESEAFARPIAKDLGIPVIMVNESGASIYSASRIAREEFPDKDITVRGAVSIGRRLMDPLSELVKLDPNAIGVGQYQHDVDQGMLQQSLSDVVQSCVNSVGVQVNTASPQLLKYVSGITPRTAEGICKFRELNGPFSDRKQLLKVPGIGPKAFEQSAGFIRIREAKNPLDSSAVHPESYRIVERMAQDLGCSIRDLMEQPQLRRKIRISSYVTDTIGLPTLQDIMSELEKPGRDPRDNFTYASFSEDVHEITDLTPGMKLPGVVTNVTAFGAFVDVGVHQDGLVHISKLSNSYVKDPNEVVRVNQQVTVTVMDVDLDRRRISLSMQD